MWYTLEQEVGVQVPCLVQDSRFKGVMTEAKGNCYPRMLYESIWTMCLYAYRPGLRRPGSHSDDTHPKSLHVLDCHLTSLCLLYHL